MASKLHIVHELKRHLRQHKVSDHLIGAPLPQLHHMQRDQARCGRLHFISTRKREKEGISASQLRNGLEGASSK